MDFAYFHFRDYEVTLLSNYVLHAIEYLQNVPGNSILYVFTIYSTYYSILSTEKENGNKMYNGN